MERPGLAGALMRALQSTLAQCEIDLEESDGEKCALEVLNRVNVDLRREVLGAFRDEHTTINYAHQILDFITDDALANAARVNVPMLLISSEYDNVATPAMSRAAAAVFPHSRYIHVRGATHYCLYDRPELIAGLLKAFFADETRLPGARGEMVEII
jgi:pimeloyl-ACP methyl ester carboxylesterase